jgi:hypothetical protein
MYNDESIFSPRNRLDGEALERMLGTNPSEGCPQKAAPGGLRLPDGFPLASVYAPTQVFRELYDRDEALMRGTIFKELDLPFLGATVTKGGGCRG